MEDEAQKTVALKKAYAEIILNTAKEAAARVMASERRALRFQQDLCATKDESLRMLLRLKQMIDSKTTEAEMTSLSQRRRIEELEAQLNEAEDVISDLRTDLEQLWDELEKVKNNQRQPLNGQVMKEDASSHKKVASEPVVTPPTSGLETVATSDMKNSPLDQRVSVNRSCNTTKETEQLSVSLLENYSSNNSNFASIITSSKEPELYRNGFTQRIRAFERTILDGQVPSSGDVDDQHSLKKNEFITKVIDKEDGKGSLPSTRTKHKEMVNSPEEEEKKPVKVLMLRRKRTRFGKAKSTSRKCHPGQLMKPSKPSSGLPCCKKNGNIKSANGACALPFIKGECVNMISKSSVSDEKLQHKSSCHKEEVKVVHKGKGKRKMKRRDAAASLSSHPNQLSEPCQPSSILSRCRTLSYLVNSNVKSGEDSLKIIETEVNTKPMTCLDPGLTLIRSDVDPISGSTNLTISIKAKEINKSGLAQNAVEMDTASLDESVLVKHEGDAAENLTIQSSELDLGMVKIPLMDSYSKQTKTSEEMNGSPSQADNNGLLRYTFQRKRKKESLSNSDENTSVEDSAIKRRVGEMQSGAPEPQNSSLIIESSRDSRRLIQVARQLISLSGKRW